MPGAGVVHHITSIDRKIKDGQLELCGIREHRSLILQVEIEVDHRFSVRSSRSRMPLTSTESVTGLISSRFALENASNWPVSLAPRGETQSVPP